MGYNSFSTTKNKLSKILDGYKEIRKEIINVPNNIIDYRSENFFQGGTLIPIVLNYEADNFTNDSNDFFLEIIFENIDDITLSSIRLFPVFYGIVSNELVTYRYQQVDEMWEVRGKNVVVGLSLYFDIETDFDSVPTFMNLYAVKTNIGLFYNV